MDSTSFLETASGRKMRCLWKTWKYPSANPAPKTPRILMELEGIFLTSAIKPSPPFLVVSIS